jgi:hypothetical protein
MTFHFRHPIGWRQVSGNLSSIIEDAQEALVVAANNGLETVAIDVTALKMMQLHKRCDR